MARRIVETLLIGVMFLGVIVAGTQLGDRDTSPRAFALCDRGPWVSRSVTVNPRSGRVGKPRVERIYTSDREGPGDPRSPEEAALRQERGDTFSLLRNTGWSDDALNELTLRNMVVTDRTATRATVWVDMDGEYVAKIEAAGSDGSWITGAGEACGPPRGLDRWLRMISL